jgi:hypothetical protein
MALSTYSELQSAVADWLHRSDLTTQIVDFIALAEADMQVRAKLSQWDTEAAVAVTSGSGSLPADFASAISATYGSQSGVLQFLSGAYFDNYNEYTESGEPVAFTVRGANLLVAPAATGTVNLRYTARFTPLSGSATTNSLLQLFPDAYLNGTLMHACSWLNDNENMGKYAAVFEAAINRIRTYMLDYRYPQGLMVRVA